MRKKRSKRSKLRGPNHPDLLEPGPLDACGWCLNWIPQFEEPDYRSVTFKDGLVLAAGEVIDLLIDDRIVIACAPMSPFYEVMVKAGAHAMVTVCSEECAAALTLAMDKDIARQNGLVMPDRVVSDEERREAAALLKDHCAWCHGQIADDAPIETVSASLTGPIEGDDEMISVDVGGRKVHALVPPLGFPMPDGHQVLFVVCSHECAAAICAAVGSGPAAPRPS